MYTPSFFQFITIFPFVLLLGMIATGPVLYPHFWHRWYAWIACSLGIGVLAYYLVVMGDMVVPVHAVADYVMFISLIGALYMASSSILIEVGVRGSVLTNLLFLWGGAMLSNVIGTTGASMLLIRPYIRMNGKRVRAYHIVFFIFMVSNVGGALTAIADPPNFIGFLKGVPFFWTLWHNFLPWCLALGGLSLAFYLVDRYAGVEGVSAERKGGWVNVRGRKNIFWLLVIVGAVFIDPNLFEGWVPAIRFHGHRFSFVREIIWVVSGFLCYRGTEKEVLEKNGFSFEPLKEVVFIFIGIFGTMMPALALIDELAGSSLGQKMITPHSLYWCTGILSSVLDNAPTYLSFLTAGMASKSLDVQAMTDVAEYAKAGVVYLRATSLAAVFFGAMTYIGNGPNFMVRAIAIENKVEMPSFGRYIVRYSIPFLLPVLVLVWLVFFC